MTDRPVTRKGPRRLGLVAPLLFAVTAASCGGSGSSSSGGSAAAGTKALVGVFKIDGGTCASAGAPKGSWFRMIQVGGNPTAGPFVTNGDSSCADKTVSALLPGTDGGLRTGTFQAAPASPFDAKGNGMAALITQPTKWFAVSFAMATNPRDPQTGIATPAPSITVSGGRLAGDLRSLGAAWNGQNFNQGAPKPDGSRTGNTSGPTGTYDAATHHYTLDWTSQIAGGPFNNFTGMWHLEGTFQAGA